MALNGVSANGYYIVQSPQLRPRQYAAYPQRVVPQQQFVPPPKRKTGFWEGVGAFFKGLVKPVINMLKHPIRTLLFAAGAAALIIGTGGAATPFLIGAGLALGGFQTVKGTVKAIIADTREETLAALEDTGEGVFTVAASVAGAKSYASTTSAGSATAAAAAKTGKLAQAWTYAKGLGKDSWFVLKEAPGSAVTTWNMIKSGEFTGNLASAYDATMLALRHRRIAKMRGVDPLRAKYAQQKYLKDYRDFWTRNDARADKIAQYYGKTLDALEKSGQLESKAADMAVDGIARMHDNQFVAPKSMNVVWNAFKPQNHYPETFAIAALNPTDRAVYYPEIDYYM